MKTKQNLQVIEILHIFLDILGLCEGGGELEGDWRPVVSQKKK